MLLPSVHFPWFQNHTDFEGCLWQIGQIQLLCLISSLNALNSFWHWYSRYHWQWQSMVRLETHRACREWGSWGHWGQHQLQALATSMEMGQGWGEDGMGHRPSSAGPMDRQGRAVNCWRPALLHHFWSRACTGTYFSPLLMHLWLIYSWEEELQKDITCFFHVYPKKSAENTSPMKN